SFTLQNRKRDDSRKDAKGAKEEFISISPNLASFASLRLGSGHAWRDKHSWSGSVGQLRRKNLTAPPTH
ncbi:MAG: hypothetical protein ACREOR_03055, partial [Candidatus Binatia bacterium]